MSDLDPRYTLCTSLEEMLAPATLSVLLAKPVTRVACRPMNGHAGLAGGQLYYVDTDASRFVLKRMSMAADWIMFASQDHLCRAITLWQYGLLDRLRPHLEHKIVACARDNGAWAILMDDLTGHVFSWETPIAPDLVARFLDGLAHLHATFWNHPYLQEPCLGLCDSARLLDMSSLPMAQKYGSPAMGVIPEWVRVGWEVMEELLDADVFTQMRSLIENPQPVFAALNRYPCTLLHGDFRAENLAYSSQPVALDWQEATRSLMTIDLAWFVRGTFVHNTMGEAGAIRYYRKQLEDCLGRPFPDTEWQEMVDLGRLVDALRITCVDAYWYRQNADNPEGRSLQALRVKTRNQQVRDAMRWLEE